MFSPNILFKKIIFVSFLTKGTQRGYDMNRCFRRREMHQPLHPNFTLIYKLVNLVTMSNPLQGCGNQSQSALVSKREMNVLLEEPRGILGPGLAGEFV